MLEKHLPLGGPARRGIEQIAAAVADGSEMVKRISQTTRVGNAESSGLRADLNEVAIGAIEQARPRIESVCSARHQVELITDLSATDAIVSGFAAELREVVVNLVANAIDSLECKGSVTVRTRNEGDRVVLQVEDTGSGFSEETRKKLFRPFFTTKMDRGTGLGLSTSFATIRRHGGEFRVQSEPGKGSVFSIVLPTIPSSSHQS